ncbi:JAB1/Mov34/MPN/PAD-1 ubiquitin protease-domain-containing protein [Mucor mucedo]|uniref:JAB1/Mov34/MPN/PAD-1 ubiquitin protease-domain-containing protein n=1 Tax=Mucor mucedo TaxID=29922 RepID=UPI00222088CA|nr:JAB1/Mov34/MPN/PAD-1 ubiquitin protease-domain-containing protein [Mucor mucedo]KAI7867893.1 JAB1/Mov34/MPN/PAD-1 ubiquitin protease-domain-containing protein [Mucor mucedo]
MLNQVNLPANIYHLILSHAYSTENEEIIGMLIGYWETIPSKNPYNPSKEVAQVKHISFLTRIDKRKDRVEIAPECLHLAVLEAEEFSESTGTPMGVIGWYHSHPHITVFPSHVDVRTQLSQQMMDDRFFGIIVSCFDSHTDNTEKLQITCFQSEEKNGTPTKLNIPLLIVPTPSILHDLYAKLPQHMHEEHKKEYIASNGHIRYDLRFAKSDQQEKSLPNVMTQLYNAGVYGQLTTSLIDQMVIPATHALDLKAIALDKEIQHLLSTTSSQDLIELEQL